MLKIIQTPSPNFNARRAPFETGPQYLMMHYTDGPSAERARYLLTRTDTEHPVSAHYLIDEDGTIEQLVDDTQRAWHAGNGNWRGITDMNSASIGIEVQNPGHSYGLRPFPPGQIAALIALSHALMQRWKIPPENVIGHSDFAPGRKVDPGPFFPWEELAKHGIGIWPRAV